MQGTGIFRSDLFIASLAYIQILNREALTGNFSEFGLCLNSLLNIHSNFLHPLAFRFPETIPTKKAWYPALQESRPEDSPMALLTIYNRENMVPRLVIRL